MQTIDQPTAMHRHLLALCIVCTSLVAGNVYAATDYADLVTLHQQFIDWRNNFEPSRTDHDSVAGRVTELQQLQDRLQALSADDWTREQEADYLAVRAQMNEYDFTLQISRPWFRDPGSYVDRMLWVAFTDLPVEAEQRDELIERLQSVVRLSQQARSNLAEATADYTDLALYALSNPDGVGHGHPRRTVPPAGVIGWYQDLQQRAQQTQPELLEHINPALAAVQAFQQWLQQQRPQLTAESGVGRKAFDWYLRQVKMMPYDADDILLMSQRELDRLRASYALAEHRNRDLPELELPADETGYTERVADLDADIRAFIQRQKLITVPDYIPADFEEMGYNVRWIKRPGGPNYWEHIQFRDPSPDHWHAVIPGHRFDSMLREHLEHPIRSKLYDGARAEGWAVYLEELPLQLGFYTDRPRTRELIYNFGLFRAVRSIGDVRLQLNQMTTDDVMRYWMQLTPGLDKNVARVDAEIYLRRPPGYGLGYTIGHLQMQKLLADRRWQQGDEFNLQAFHDQLMRYGWMPLSLIRYAMTGNDDEVRLLREHIPLESLLRSP